MAGEVFRIQGTIQVDGSQAIRQLNLFQQVVVNSARSIRNNFQGLDRVFGSFSGFFTGLQFKRLADGFLQASIKSETFRTQMQLIVKDMEKVKELTSFIEKYEAKTPFDLPELQKATVLFTKLTKVRDESLNKVPEYIKLAGEMAAIFDKPLAKATEGLFKTFSGSALGLTILRNNFAITKAELEKFGVAFDKSGRIKNFQMQIGVVEEAIKKIIMGLSGMKLAEARSQTLFGRLETLSSEVYRTARLFGDALAPMVMTAVDRLILLNQAIQNLDPNIVNLVAIIVGFGAALGSLIITFGPIFFFTNQMIMSFIALAEATTTATGGLTAAAQVVQFLVTPVTELGAVLAAAAGSAGALGGAVASFGAIFSGLATFVGSATALFTTFLGVLGAVVSAFINWATAIGAWTTVVGEFTAGVAALTVSMEGLGVGVTALGTAMAAALSSASLFRLGLYGVAGAAAAALLEIKRLTDYQNQANKEDEDRLSEAETEKNRDYVNFARNQIKPGSAPTGRGVTPKLTDEQIAANEVLGKFAELMNPEAVKLLDQGVDSKEIQKRIKSLKAAQNNSKNKLGNGEDTFLEQDKELRDIVNSDLFKKEMQDEIDLGRATPKTARSKALGKYMKGRKAWWMPGAQAYTEADLTAMQARDQYRESEKQAGGYGFDSAVTGGNKQAISYYESQLSKVQEIEKYRNFNKIGPEQATADFTEIKRKSQVEIDTSSQTFEKLLQLRKGYYDSAGQLRDGFKDLDQKTEKMIVDYASKASKERQNIAKKAFDVAEAQEQQSLQAKQKNIEAQAAAITKTVNQNGGKWTKDMAADWTKLHTQWLENQKDIVEENRKGQIEITRIEQGESAARLLELDHEVAQRRLRGQDEVDITKWKEDQKRQIELNRIKEVQDAENAIQQQKEAAATQRGQARLGKEEWELGRGDRDFGGVRAAREALDAIEDANANAAMDREIKQAQQAASGNVTLTAKLKETMKAIRDRYKAEKEARDQARGQRNTELSEQEETTRRQDQIDIAKQGQSMRDFKIDGLKEMQDQGTDVSDQIIQALKDRYDMAVKIINAEAENAKVGKDAIDAAKIEADRKMQILELSKAATKEMREQLALKKAAEDKKKADYFASGPMTLEQSQAQDKARSEESRKRYQGMVNKEKLRSGQGINPLDRDAANKLGIPTDVQNPMFNPISVDVKPIKLDITMTLKQPGAGTTSQRVQTSTDKKNENKKSNTNQKGKNTVGD